MIGLSDLDVSSPVSYLVALIVPGLDALLPVLPTFEDRPWAGLLLALGAALGLSVLAEVFRRTRPWRLLARAGSRPVTGSAEPGTHR